MFDRQIGVVKKGGAWFSALAEDLNVKNPTDESSSTIMLGQVSLSMICTSQVD